MKTEYTIAYVEKPEESAWGIIGRGLHQYNQQQAGDNKFQTSFSLPMEKSPVASSPSCNVDLMWIEEELRGQGYGHRLTQIENEARKRGAEQVYLDTFSFQAPEFYKQHGDLSSRLWPNYKIFR
ncbi:MAG: GNAT family N-acetyltransferase [Ardenticatenaceae bacterium]|nr:GNAT family N-acetyltransferase [Ardenticatenaceae bacterium]